jgi:hypothetical protein
MNNPFRSFNSSPEVIRLMVMLYIRYPLSLRKVEEILFDRHIPSREAFKQDRSAALAAFRRTFTSAKLAGRLAPCRFGLQVRSPQGRQSARRGRRGLERNERTCRSWSSRRALAAEKRVQRWNTSKCRGSIERLPSPTGRQDLDLVP